MLVMFALQFAQLEHAKAAQSALNGKLEIAGRTIKVAHTLSKFSCLFCLCNDLIVVIELVSVIRLPS